MCYELNCISLQSTNLAVFSEKCEVEEALVSYFSKLVFYIYHQCKIKTPILVSLL